ncbi:MAG: hypothetical protein ACLFVP_10090 [Candidatus Bathyarchaeia archaeon]
MRAFHQTKSTYKSIVDIQSKIREQKYFVDGCVDDGIELCKIASLPLNGEEIIRESKEEDKLTLNYYSSLRKGLDRIQPFMVDRRIYSWDDLREYASEAALLLSMIKKNASQKKCEEILNIKPPKTEEDIGKQLDDLKTLQDKEKWFMDFEELPTSLKVLNNLHKIYFKI